MPVAQLRRPLLAAVAVLLLALLAVQRLQGGPRAEAQPAVARPAAVAARPALLVVHVVGAVRRPGLYHLGEGTRVADAVHAAGGATHRAELEGINLAAPLADGEQVLVPRRGTTAASTGPGAAAAPVQLSVATVEQLDALPGIGPATAQRIVAYREEHGPFRSVDELVGVPGIGPAKLEAVRDLVVP
jgi:competence protein ComEA